MEPFDLDFLLRALPGGATLAGGDSGARFTGVATDSRAVRPGDLFVALAGERFDGNDFVEAALAAGAAGAVAREGARFSPRREAPVILVRDPLRALGALAAEVRRRLRAAVVAITGSSGKTTTRDLVAQALGEGTVSAEKSFNNALGVPLTIFRAERETRVLVLEVGTSAPGEIASLGRIARPDVAVITNVGPAHLERLGSVEGVAREKGALVEALREGGVAVLNADDPLVSGMRARVPAGRGAVLFGTGEEARVRGAIAVEPWGTRLEVSIAGGPPIALRLRFPGRHNAMNALAALATVHALGRPVEEAALRLERARLPGRRLEALRVGPIEVLDDAYNANPASTAAALEVLAASSARRIFVFGGMRELGAEEKARHREIGALAARAGIALFLAVGDEAAIALDGAREAGLPAERTVRAEEPGAAADLLLPALLPGDLVLVKGSRAARLERFIERLRTLLDARGANAA
jgi:UDP-N-acetylmuramoyl-tripeptide--D-alanyl-D-alanine ligase